MMTNDQAVEKTVAKGRGVEVWLFVVLVAVLVMVAVGGLTRLTDSGLSMTDWKPLLGMKPPMDAAGWEERFAMYRELPQFQMFADQGRDVSMVQFKWMFFWEYFHRMLGRVTGLIALVPFLWFLLRGRFRGGWTLRMFAIPLLIAAQGLLGWFMVRSGLVDLVYVSHYRLAAHLLLAFFVFYYTVWQWLAWRRRRVQAPNWRRSGMAKGAWWLAGLLFVQIVYGAFVAGLKAGPAYTTWPLYHGDLWPTGIWSGVSALWSSGPVAHVVHRSLAVLVVVGVIGLWISGKGKEARLRPRQRRSVWGMMVLVFIQFGLGIATVMLATPMWLAAIHQVNACLLVGSLAGVNFNLGR